MPRRFNHRDTYAIIDSNTKQIAISPSGVKQKFRIKYSARLSVQKLRDFYPDRNFEVVQLKKANWKKKDDSPLWNE